ncbi:Glutamate receptor ionotropic, NMDA 2B [Bulinus truncatus]|nr:Glutamate receptor ionotropic, NMDA 2B [Bulinus truncatus]
MINHFSTEPYDYPSWSLILLFSVHATGASIFIFEWLSPYGLDQGRTSLRVHKFSLFRSFWLIWAMLFGASVSTDQPRGCASRFLANIWALFAVVFCASYTANLAAFMITKDDYYDLSGIQDWRLKNPHHRQPPFKYATIANSSTDLNIAKNYKAIHSYMKNDAQTSVKDAIKALKKQEIQAFIYDSTTLEYEFGKDVGCKLKTVGKRIAETGYGIAFPKKSHWVKKVDKALLKLQEDGEIERLQKFWLAGACHKKKERGVSSHTLGILNFTSAFILLGGGVILGVILLVMEHIYFRFGRKSLKKWDRCGCCSLVSLSMGQSLTFEQSVIDAIDYHRHHKCKDPLCETQLWKVKHELDIALLKISQLRRLLAHSASLEVARDQASVYKLEQHDPTQVNGNARRRRRQQKSDTVPSAGDKCANQSLLALEGKGDTDEEDGLMKPFTTSKSSPKKFASPRNTDIPLQNLQPTTQQPVQSAPIYENSQDRAPRQATSNNQAPRHATTAQLAKTHANKSKNVADLELHPPPPTFDEAVSGYSDTPPDDSSPLPPPPTAVPGSSDTSQSSDERRYEPFILDSPESPSSTFSELSDSHRLPSPGDLSKLSDEGQSSPASPSKDSNFTSSPDMRHFQGGRNSGMTSPMYSNTQSTQNKPTGYVKNNVFTDKPDNEQTMSREDDNDVSTRRMQANEGNVYVNVDDIIGKETSF